ncbi:hypothetical protein [Confluentibacter flavum]|uniref:Uncharacterized protein n=1 Tax=Confluentibacter flavum TaxID=1909700 RepID=A0A2N3HLV4_9FLAO|nr:hypothetical protein [Confluentibacter flavum]PKQ45950.1 hypothetical protein CSW08_05895 [Confluentibacter flavum]
MKANTQTKFYLESKLIGLLKTILPLHSVYVIGVNKEKKNRAVFLSPVYADKQKTVIYTLLIIGDKPMSKGLNEFMDGIYNQMQQSCKVYVIYYTLANAIKRLDYGNNFLLKTIFQTPCIYRADDTLLRFKKYQILIHPKVYEDIQKIWDARMKRAAYLLSILDSIEPTEDVTSRLMTMHYAIEQICLGLLYAFWEFKPQHYALTYMLHLCSHFSNLPQTIFPKETYGLHRMHYILCNAHHIMRFKAENEFSNRDSDKAFNRCERFFEEAMDIGDKHLEELKKIHCHTNKLD